MHIIQKNHVGVRRLSSGKLGVIWSQIAHSSLQISIYIYIIAFLYKWHKSICAYLHLDSPEIQDFQVNNPWAPGLCPPWIPQSLASSWLSPTHSGRLFSSHLQKRKQSTPQKKNDEKLNPEWKKKQTNKKGQGLLIFHSSILPLEKYLWIMKCFSTTSSVRICCLKVPKKNGWKVPARRPWWRLQEVCQRQPKSFAPSQKPIPKQHDHWFDRCKSLSFKSLFLLNMSLVVKLLFRLEDGNINQIRGRWDSELNCNDSVQRGGKNFFSGRNSPWHIYEGLLFISAPKCFMASRGISYNGPAWTKIIAAGCIWIL